MRICLTLLYLTVIVNSILLCQDPEKLLSEAKTKMKTGDLRYADSLLQESLKIDPSFAPSIVAQSELWLRKGSLNKALEFASRGVQLDEDSRPWIKEMESLNSTMVNAMQNLKQGLKDLAFKDFESVTKKYPYFPQPYYNMGIIRYKEKDIEGTAYYAKEVLRIYPEHKKAKVLLKNVIKLFYNSGNKAYKRGDLEKAITQFQKAVEYDNQYFLAYYQLGVLEKKMGNSDQAISYFNKAIDIKPDFHKAWFTLGTSYEADNNLDSAIVKYSAAIEISPGYTKAYGNLGNVYRLKEDYISAKDILMTVIQIDPTFSKGYYNLGIVYSDQELYLEASEQFKKATEYDEKNHDIWHRYATSLNSIEDWGNASLASQKCIDLKGKFGGGWYEKGVAEMGRGNKTRALKYFDEANKYRNFRKVAQDKIDRIKNPLKYQK